MKAETVIESCKPCGGLVPMLVVQFPGRDLLACSLCGTLRVTRADLLWLSGGKYSDTKPRYEPVTGVAI